MIKCAIFDMAGTTVQDDGVVLEAMQRALRCINSEFTDELVNQFMGMDKKLTIRSLLDLRVDKIHDHFEKILISHYEHNAKEIDGTTAVFKELQEMGVKVCLNTGFPRSIADTIIRVLEWEDYIDYSVTSDEVENGRPSPEMIHVLMDAVFDEDFLFLDQKAYAAMSEMTIKVGDTESDLNEGINANVHTAFGVCTGTCSREDLDRRTGSYSNKGGRGAREGMSHIVVIDSVRDIPSEIRRINASANAPAK